MSALDFFFERCIPEPNSGCWLWFGCVSKNGYGQIRKDYIQESAHRTSYRIFKGEIPDGCTIDHLCRVRSCVNPDHLEAVTQKVNGMRAPLITTVNAMKIACHAGHEFTASNTYYFNGKRHCRACHAHRMRRYRKRQQGVI